MLKIFNSHEFDSLVCFFCLNNLNKKKQQKKQIKFVLGNFCLICLKCIKACNKIVLIKNHEKIFKLNLDFYDKFKYCLDNCFTCENYYDFVNSLNQLKFCIFNKFLKKNNQNDFYDRYIFCNIKICDVCDYYYNNKFIFYLKKKYIYEVNITYNFYKNENEILNSISPEEIYLFLNKYVIGQKYIKKVISSSIYNHYKKFKLNKNFNYEIKKSNILMIGPTGSGKTFIIKTISKLLNIPIVIIDSTSLTQTGYVGEDVSSIIQKLFDNSGQDIGKTENGIVFIDEIDKISIKSSSFNRDISGEGVQQSLLKLIESSFCSVTFKTSNTLKNIQINTENILFICGGAFLNLNFNEILEENKIINTNKLIEFGIIPELIGRFSIIIIFKNLNIEYLKNILVKSKNSILLQYNKLLISENIEILILNSSLNLISKIVYNKNLGSRNLKNIIDVLLINIIYKINSLNSLKKIIIHDQNILKNINPILIYDF